MRKALFIILLFVYQSSFCQELFPLEIVNDTFKLSLNFRNGNFEIKSEIKDVSPNQILKVESIKLEDGGLVISYFPNGIKSQFSYHIGLLLIDENGKMMVPKEYQLGGVISAKGTKKKDAVLQKIFWNDIVEGILFPENEYTLVVTKSLLGIVDCSKQRPRFKQSYVIQHTVSGAIGLGLLGSSIIFHQQKKSNYNQYESIWVEGATVGAAQKFFDDAESARKTAQWTSLAGVVVLLADGGWFYYRLKRLRKKQEIYDRFCTENELSFLVPKPIYYPDAEGAIALKWSFQF